MTHHMEQKKLLQPYKLLGAKLTVLVLGALLSGAANATNGSIRLNFELSPTGEFSATSNSLEGIAYQQGPQILAPELKLNLDTLKTDIDLRDEHMKRDYLETQKFPQATLRNVVAANGTFSGTLTIKNQSKPIQGTYTLDGKDLTAKFDTNFDNWGIKKAKYLGVGVESTVRVEAKLKIGEAPKNTPPARAPKPKPSQRQAR